MNILTVVGSSRKDSYNQVLANYLKEKYGDKYNFKQADLDSLPIYSQDIENDTIPSVVKLREDVKWADGVILLTPEYNFTMSVLMNNFITWCSRVEYVLSGKPVMISGATMGQFGTVMAQSHLRQTLLSPYVDAIPVPRTEAYITTIQNKVKDGKFIEEEADYLNRAFKNFIYYIENISGSLE